jgi:hypothetical protein
MKKLSFTLDRPVIEVELIDPTKPADKQLGLYKLITMTGKGREQLNDLVNPHFTDVVEDGKKVRKLNKAEGLSAAVLTRTMVEVEGVDKEKAVTTAFVDNLPGTVTQKLVDAALELNGLTEKSKEEAKNV